MLSLSTIVLGLVHIEVVELKVLKWDLLLTCSPSTYQFLLLKYNHFLTLRVSMGYPRLFDSGPLGVRTLHRPCPGREGKQSTHWTRPRSPGSRHLEWLNDTLNSVTYLSRIGHRSYIYCCVDDNRVITLRFIILIHSPSNSTGLKYRRTIFLFPMVEYTYHY